MNKLLTTVTLAATLLAAGTASAGGQAVLAINEKLNNVYGNLGGQFRDSYGEQSFVNLLQSIDEREIVQADDFMALTLSQDDEGNLFITEQEHAGVVLQEGIDDTVIQQNVDSFIDDINYELFDGTHGNIDITPGGALDGNGNALVGAALYNIIDNVETANERLIRGDDRLTVVEEFYAEVNPDLARFNAASQVINQVADTTSTFSTDSGAWDLGLELYNFTEDGSIQFGNRGIEVNTDDHNSTYADFIRYVDSDQLAYYCNINPSELACSDAREYEGGR